MSDYIRDRVGWLTDRDFAAMLCDDFKLPGIEPDDFLHRELRIGDARALTGIRFLNLNPQRPFVDLEAVTGDVPLHEWCDAALTAWQKFKPQSVRWYTPGAEPPPLPAGWQVEADQHLLVGYLGEVEPCADRVELAVADPDEALSWLQTSYAAFHERAPHIHERVCISSIDELRGCQERGKLVWWHRNGERAGLLGVDRMAEFGYDGFQVDEEAVDPAHVGHGTAAAAQGEVIRMLASDHPGLAFFGTIAGRNVPSLKTAARNGRVIHGTWWFLRK